MSGFTTWTLPGDAKRVYVSTSGSDANDGLTDSTPKLTLAAGYALLTNGKGDHLCLKRGEVWTESIPSWTKSGKNASEPMLLTYYGTGARPIMQADGGPGAGNGNSLVQIGNANGAYSHIVFTGIHFRAINYDGDVPTNGGVGGLFYLSGGTNFWIEDCKFDGLNNSCVCQGWPTYDHDADTGGMSGFTFRRNIVANPMRSDAGGTGIFLDSVTDGFLIEENLFYQTAANELAGNKLSHNQYTAEHCQYTTANICRNNIYYNARSNLTMRPSAVVENNLCIKAALGLTLGHFEGDPLPKFTGQCAWNVITESRPHWNGQELGWGLSLSYCGDGLLIARNLIAHSTGTHQSHFGMVFNAATQRSIIADNIVYNWRDVASENAISALVLLNAVIGPVLFRDNVFDQPIENWILSAETAGPSALANCTFKRNRYSAARSSCFYNVGPGIGTIAQWIANIDTTGISGAPAYPDITRTVGKYYASIGGTDDTEAFVVAASNREIGEWDERYTAAAANAWIRAGFYAMSYTQAVCDAIWSSGTRTLLTGSPHAAGDYTQNICNEVWDEAVRELTIPEPPTDIVVAFAGSNVAQVVAEESATSGITRYRAYRGTVSGSLTLAADTSTDPLRIYVDGGYVWYEPNDLTPGATYYVTLKAVDGDGVESDPTDEVSFTTEITVPVDDDPLFALGGVNVNPAARELWNDPDHLDGDQAVLYASVTLSSADPISANLCGRIAPYEITGTVVAWRVDILCEAGQGIGPIENGYWVTPELYASDGTALLTGVGTAVPPGGAGVVSIYLQLADGISNQDVIDAIAAGINNESPTLPYGLSLVGFGDNTATVTFLVYNASLVAILQGGNGGGGGATERGRTLDRITALRPMQLR